MTLLRESWFTLYIDVRQVNNLKEITYWTKAIEECEEGALETFLG